MTKKVSHFTDYETLCLVVPLDRVEQTTGIFRGAEAEFSPA